MAEMLTAKEISEREKISVQAVYKRMRLNKIKPCRKVVEGRSSLVFPYVPPESVIEDFKQERERLNRELQNTKDELKNALERISLKDRQILLIEDNSKRFKDELNEVKSSLKTAEKRVIEIEVERGNLKEVAEKLGSDLKSAERLNLKYKQAILALSAVLLVVVTVIVMILFNSRLG